MNARIVTYGLLSALALSGCTTGPGDSPIRIGSAIPLKASKAGDTCEREEVALLGGSLDVSATLAYYTSFDVENDTQELATSSGGDELVDGSRNAFVATELITNYTSTPA